MSSNYFEKNVMAIIPETGELINVKKRPQELYHYQTFTRVAMNYIPDFYDDVPLDPRAYTGYNYAIMTAQKGYAIILPVNFSSNDVIILALPTDLTKKQKETIDNFLPQLFEHYLYILPCNRNNKSEDEDDVGYYQINKYQEKNLDMIKDLIIKDNNHKK